MLQLFTCTLTLGRSLHRLLTDIGLPLLVLLIDKAWIMVFIILQFCFILKSIRLVLTKVSVRRFFALLQMCCQLEAGLRVRTSGAQSFCTSLLMLSGFCVYLQTRQDMFMSELLGIWAKTIKLFILLRALASYRHKFL